jgi:hypothetical protein
MEMQALIDELGRVELPDFVRTQLGVKPGGMVSLDEQDGKWFLGPVTAPESGETMPERSAPDLVADDDLSWEELDYAPVPLQPVARIDVRISQAGSLKPMSHELARLGPAPLPTDRHISAPPLGPQPSNVDGHGWTPGQSGQARIGQHGPRPRLGHGSVRRKASWRSVPTPRRVASETGVTVVSRGNKGDGTTLRGPRVRF